MDPPFDLDSFDDSDLLDEDLNSLDDDDSDLSDEDLDSLDDSDLFDENFDLSDADCLDASGGLDTDSDLTDEDFDEDLGSSADAPDASGAFDDDAFDDDAFDDDAFDDDAGTFGIAPDAAVGFSLDCSLSSSQSSYQSNTDLLSMMTSVSVVSFMPSWDSALVLSTSSASVMDCVEMLAKMSSSTVLSRLSGNKSATSAEIFAGLGVAPRADAAAAAASTSCCCW